MKLLDQFTLLKSLSFFYLIFFFYVVQDFILFAKFLNDIKYQVGKMIHKSILRKFTQRVAYLFHLWPLK